MKVAPPRAGEIRLAARGREIGFPRPRPLVMGIVNINDDSFSGDGSLAPEAALASASRHLAAGADVIDIGAESARTNRAAISPAEEIARLEPFLEAWPRLAAEAPPGPRSLARPLLSLNSWRPEVVGAILASGEVDLLNDIGGLPTAANAELCARAGCALLIMHSAGEPKVPRTGQRYADVLGTVLQFFEDKLELAHSAGLAREATVLDPGIDFAKDRADNLTLLRHAARLNALGRPVLMPISRKTVIGEVLEIEEPALRDSGTLACAVASMLRGAAILRVHDVAGAVAATRVLERLA